MLPEVIEKQLITSESPVSKANEIQTSITIDVRIDETDNQDKFEFFFIENDW